MTTGNDLHTTKTDISGAGDLAEVAKNVFNDVFDAPHSVVSRGREAACGAAALGNNGSVVVQVCDEESKAPCKQRVSGSCEHAKPCIENPSPDQFRSRRKHRKEMWTLQRGAARLSNPLYKDKFNPVWGCRWHLQYDVQQVDVLVSKDANESTSCYKGLQNCGSVWMCPVCAARISETRRIELNEALAWAREQGIQPVLVTATSRHRKRDSLEAQLEGMKEARRQMRQWRKLRDVRKKFVLSSITATEVTYGKHGWHTHFHEIFFVENIEQFSIVDTYSNEDLKEHNKQVRRLKKQGLLDHEIDAELRIQELTEEFTMNRSKEDLAVEVLKNLGQEWVKALQANGLDGVEKYAWDCQDASVAGSYVAKWGAAEELTLASKKYGKKADLDRGILAAEHGSKEMQTIEELEDRRNRKNAEKHENDSRNPSELLVDAVVYKDKEAAKLWRHYAKNFKGRMQLTWSRGLKDRIGINDIDDEEAAQEDALEMIELTQIDAFVWSYAKHRRLLILDVAETSRDPEEVENAAMYGDPDPEYLVSRDMEVIEPYHCVTDDTSQCNGSERDEAEHGTGSKRNRNVEDDSPSSDKKRQDFGGKEGWSLSDRSGGAVPSVPKEFKCNATGERFAIPY